MNASIFFPAGSSAIGGAFDWLQGTLLGTVATTVAVIAVASVGFLMLTGRIDVRRAATVILGCFIIFGASSIALGIMTGASAVGRSTSPGPEIAQRSLPPVSPPAYPQAPVTPYDPYAGAAVPPL